MILSRSWRANPSSLLLSNNKAICRCEGAVCNLRCFTAFLPNERVIDSGVCGVGSASQQPVQLDERRQFDTRRTNGHTAADHRIKHPTGNRNHEASRSQNLQKLARRPLFNAPYADLAAKIRVPPIMNYQILADMGRMNGEWR